MKYFIALPPGIDHELAKQKLAGVAGVVTFDKCYMEAAYYVAGNGMQWGTRYLQEYRSNPEYTEVFLTMENV